MTLSAKDLSISRGGIPVLQGLSFSVEPGQALILRGANGIGKTSLLRCLAGLAFPVSGEITGAEETTVYAGHLDGLKAAMSLRENLAFWARIFGLSAADAVDAALGDFDLAHLSQRPAQFLSAGQKRRLGLARLLVSGRKIWLLDEPTVSLDQENVVRFGVVLKRHLDSGGSAIIASHIDLGTDAPVLKLDPFRADPATRSDPFLAGDF